MFPKFSVQNNKSRHILSRSIRLVTLREGYHVVVFQIELLLNVVNTIWMYRQCMPSAKKNDRVIRLTVSMSPI